MRAFIDCSEPCKAATFREFEETFRAMGVRMGQLQTCYAMAETTYAVTQSRIGEVTRSVSVDQMLLSRTGEVRPVAQNAGASAEFLSVGPAIEGAEILILDDQGQAAPGGRMGEIALRSTSLFSGYFELPDVTARVFHDGWYLTGDLGFLLEGELYITGRKKEMFIVRGRNFFAHEIESAVNACEGVKPGRAVAIGVFNDAIGSEEVTVIAESEVEDPVARRRISTAVKLLLDERMGLQVRSVEVVAPGWLIKTTSGKISRKENLVKYQAQRASGTAAVPQVPGAAG
jgi:acyl-CoA synthetase (AMP-forming)/AMP-acid ligase II